MVESGTPAPATGGLKRTGPRGRAKRTGPLGRALGVAGLGAGLMVALSSCSIDDVFYLGWPRTGLTPQSQRTFDLWIGAAVTALAIGVFVWGLIFWCVVAYRKRSDELPPQTRFNLPIELIYSVMPFLVISVLFYYTAVIETDITRVSPNPDLVVKVEPFRWNWKFVYPDSLGPDDQPVQTVGTSDYVPVLVVPTNRQILFRLHSSDVIHSFWVPDMLFKRDVFPGNVINEFETTILTEGAYVGRCAELCGEYHFGMNFELRAVSPERFARFLEAKQTGASTPDALSAIGEAPLAVTTSPFPTKLPAARS